VRFQNLICFVLLYWFAWLVVVVGYCLAGWYASSVVGSLVRWFVCFHLCLVDQNTHLISIVSVAPIYVISLVSVVWILYLNEKKIGKEAMQDYACKEDKRHSLDTSTEPSPLSFSPHPTDEHSFDFCAVHWFLLVHFLCGQCHGFCGYLWLVAVSIGRPLASQLSPLSPMCAMMRC
jgi:hypothetical protein